MADKAIGELIAAEKVNQSDLFVLEQDGAAKKLGIDVFFLIDCLINQEGRDISGEPHGSWEDLMAYILKK